MDQTVHFHFLTTPPNVTVLNACGNEPLDVDNSVMLASERRHDSHDCKRLHGKCHQVFEQKAFGVVFLVRTGAWKSSESSEFRQKQMFLKMPEPMEVTFNISLLLWLTLLFAFFLFLWNSQGTKSWLQWICYIWRQRKTHYWRKTFLWDTGLGSTPDLVGAAVFRSLLCKETIIQHGAFVLLLLTAAPCFTCVTCRPAQPGS